MGLIILLAPCLWKQAGLQGFASWAVLWTSWTSGVMIYLRTGTAASRIKYNTKCCIFHIWKMSGYKWNGGFWMNNWPMILIIFWTLSHWSSIWRQSTVDIAWDPFTFSVLNFLNASSYHLSFAPSSANECSPSCASPKLAGQISSQYSD